VALQEIRHLRVAQIKRVDIAEKIHQVQFRLRSFLQSSWAQERLPALAGSAHNSIRQR
jgi:hypothetical protein